MHQWRRAKLITLYRLFCAYLMFQGVNLLCSRKTRLKRREERSLYLRLRTIPTESWSIRLNGCTGLRFEAVDPLDRLTVAIEKTYIATRWITLMPIWGCRLSKSNCTLIGYWNMNYEFCIYVDWLYRELRWRLRKQIHTSGLKERELMLCGPADYLQRLSERDSLHQPIG